MSFPTTFSIFETVLANNVTDLFLEYGISGTAISTVWFSLVPLTYQQFENKTGQSVTSLISSVPSPACEGKQI